MKINPVKGSKLGKKTGNPHWSLSPALLSLISNINDFNEIYYK